MLVVMYSHNISNIFMYLNLLDISYLKKLYLFEMSGNYNSCNFSCCSDNIAFCFVCYTNILYVQVVDSTYNVNIIDFWQ